MNSQIKAIAFDLDGTLYFGSQAVEGAVDALADLEVAGVKVFFITNNSTKSKSQIVKKLQGMGFNATNSNTYTASSACARYLNDEHLRAVYLIGNKDFKRDLQERFIEVVEPEKAEAVVVGLDTSMTYKSIAFASHAINRGATLVVANIDGSYPVEHGQLRLGCGAMVGAVVGATKHEPDFIAGKPNTYMLELLCQDFSISAEEICVIGDSIESDMEMAMRFKSQSILYDHYGVVKGYGEDRATSFEEIICILKKRGVYEYY